MPETLKPWTDRKLSREERGKRLVALGPAFAAQHSLRRWEAVQLYRMYRGDPIGGRGADDPLYPTDVDPNPLYPEKVEQVLNITKDLVDTAVSKLTLQDLKPQIVVTEGDWEVKRRARLVDRFIEGQFQNPQGKHKTLWSLFEHALRIALAATRTTAIKFYSDPDRGKVCAELHDTLSFIMDTSASVYDEPTWLAVQQDWDPDRLIQHLGKFGEKHSQEIWAAARPVNLAEEGLGLECVDDDYALTHTRDVYRVRVVEGWDYAIGDQMGRHVMACDGLSLEDEDYPYEDSPFVFIGGVRDLTGQWHQTLTKQVAPAICRVNEKLEDIEITAALASKRRMFYDPEEHDKKSLETTDPDMVLIPVTGLATGTRPPIEQLPDPYHPLTLELVNFYLGHSYGLTGINQFNTAGQITGDWSGVALRMMKDQLVERFASIQKDFIEGSVIQASKKIARCALETLKDSESKNFKSAWRGDGMMREVDAEVLALLDDYSYTVDLYPVSGKKNSPEDRVQLFQDLAKSGLASGDALLEVVKYYDTFDAAGGGLPDAQKKNIEQQIDSWLYDELDDIEYTGPVRSMNPATALLQVNTAYLDALTSRVNDKRLKLFERFVAEALVLVQEGNANMATMTGAGAQPGPATPMMPGTMGAPPPAPAAPAPPPGPPMPA